MSLWSRWGGINSLASPLGLLALANTCFTRPPDSPEKAISIWESENFFFDLEPLPGAVEAVKQMANLENTDVFICTSPIKTYKFCPYEKELMTLWWSDSWFSRHVTGSVVTQEEEAREGFLGKVRNELYYGNERQEVGRYAWVEKHFGPDFLEQVVLTRDKTVISADLLIDDRPDITGKWPAAGAEPNPSWEHVLFTCCHNRHVQLQPPSRRMHSWADDWKTILDSKRPC
ncbi:5'(3')-deoxyribonucleotidase, mitochondrial [Pteropus alecto]|uniref:5'(3')-deoxyribonucleotidase, mitochondrial n=1 Tax=Pteropus alecto TaxID=9402 RepID=L5KXN9_PTEAL|nr:5'(3')-deoxyribonucleotidase, mitochondrial [Pteropus alecto]